LFHQFGVLKPDGIGVPFDFCLEARDFPPEPLYREVTI